MRLILTEFNNICTNSVEISIYGTVQGVGFRPFIYCLARELNIKGNVCNDGNGVLINACSENLQILQDFVQKIQTTLPPNACISNFIVKPALNEKLYNKFEIVHSVSETCNPAVLVPDLAICQKCADELNNPLDRRYKYAFINCIHCGPRFSILKSLPYDRETTVMGAFLMCGDCKKEYTEPFNRRFHAQAIACPVCGPYLWLNDKDNNLISYNNSQNCDIIIDETVKSINNSKIVALKGLGGFHLAVNPFDETALSLLRQKKNRKYKPFALMARDIETIEKYCEVTDIEKQMLLSGESPILLLKTKKINKLSPRISPNIDTLGVMLPYTPLHRLIFDHPDCPELLVMTSGNKKDQPIINDNEDALTRLNDIADLFVMHNRDIAKRLDDSIVRIIHNKKTILRRSRGYAPKAFPLRWDMPDVLSMGAELKNTFCFIKDNLAIMGQHIGDLKSKESYDFYRNSMDFYIKLMNFKPDIIVTDLHPDYLSSVYAMELSERFNISIKTVQHHHAHALSVMAEYGLDNALAIVLDGVGLCTDKTIWGGEILYARRDGFSRFGHLSHLRMPGGDMASKEPWRMAISALFTIYGDNIPESFLTQIDIDPQKISMILNMLKNNFNCPVTSSCGRLFDAVSSILNICHINSYESQAAMELESQAESGIFELNLTDFGDMLYYDGDCIVLNTLKVIKNIINLMDKGIKKQDLARYFHITLINGVCEMIKIIFQKNNLNDTKNIVLSGGSMQNSILLSGFLSKLTEAGYNVYVPERFPMNDGGLSLGQAIILPD